MQDNAYIALAILDHIKHQVYFLIRMFIFQVKQKISEYFSNFLFKCANCKVNNYNNNVFFCVFLIK